MRYRWYRIQLPRNANSLAKLVAESPFASKSPFGFLGLNDSLGGQRFRFLWRTTVVITKVGRHGEPTYEEVANICFTDFAVVSIKPFTFLRIESPTRNVRELLNALENLVGMGFTAQQITFEHTKPTSIFEKVNTSKLLGLKVIGTVTGQDMLTRMEFASKQGIVVEKLSILNKLQYKVEFAQYELIYEGIRGQVALSANGTVKISGQLAPRLLHLIEHDLPAIK